MSAFPVDDYSWAWKLKAKERLEVAATWLLENRREDIERMLAKPGISGENMFWAIKNSLNEYWNNRQTPANKVPSWDAITKRVLALMGARPL